ncbi:MAG: hypothetical protein Q9220_007494 [cf. Caloplaca sp. 1 TL-2023]
MSFWKENKATIMFFSTPIICALAMLAAKPPSVVAKRLYVSSYAGTITTLNLIHHPNSTYTLTHLATTTGCAPNATWLTIDPVNRNLFCLDEGIDVANGSLTSFKIRNNGSLDLVQHLSVPAAPVNSALIHSSSNNSQQLLAVAHYTHALTTYTINPLTASFSPLQNFNFTMPQAPAGRQAAPHPHQVLLDPSGRYLVIPDLGADLLRVFYVNRTNLRIEPRPEISVTKGSGPRHGVFHTSFSGKETVTYYYLVSEIASTLTGYRVTYLPANGGLAMTPFVSGPATGPAVGNASKIFEGNYPAEIALSPDHKHLIVSNRNATYFTNITNPDPSNATTIASDTLSLFSQGASRDDNTAVAGGGGGEQVSFNGLVPAGGSYPRHFSLDRGGGKVAVGLQHSGRVVVYERCVESGRVGEGGVLADYEGLGYVTSVIWDECEG